MAVPEDSYRTQQLFATLAADGHPMGKFTWGNESTLNVGIPDEELHKKLHELRLRYYSAHYMTLAVQARLSLDTLQEYVTSIFSLVRLFCFDTFFKRFCKYHECVNFIWTFLIYVSTDSFHSQSWTVICHN